MVHVAAQYELSVGLQSTDSSGARYETIAWSALAALRVRLPIEVEGLNVAALVGWRMQSFQVRSDRGATLNTVPDLDAQALHVGVAARIPLARPIALTLDVAYLHGLDLGAIGQRFPASSTLGVQATAGLALRARRGSSCARPSSCDGGSTPWDVPRAAPRPRAPRRTATSAEPSASPFGCRPEVDCATAMKPSARLALATLLFPARGLAQSPPVTAWGAPPPTQVVALSPPPPPPEGQVDPLGMVPRARHGLYISGTSFLLLNGAGVTYSYRPFRVLAFSVGGGLSVASSIFSSSVSAAGGQAMVHGLFGGASCRTRSSWRPASPCSRPTARSSATGATR